MKRMPENFLPYYRERLVKRLFDCIAELREAVDFLRYYAAQAEHIAPSKHACGVMACISPWNFPLAIFSGQLSAALAVGNAVLVKPAESTSLIAFKAVQLLHDAGVPKAVLQYIPGPGRVIGAGMSSHPKINGMIFTGSTATAKHIETSMSKSADVRAPLIAETGGLNAMIVDSSALPEQAITDIVASAFQSAGQRCSALRVLYLQEDIAEHTLEMLLRIYGLTSLGNKSEWYSRSYSGSFWSCIACRRLTRLKKWIRSWMHVNEAGFGLTFGLHTRIDSRVQDIIDSLKVGNMYVNRNQIGAIVGSQPFGGEGLSGTGPKAGGPFYLKRLVQSNDGFNADTESKQIEVIESSELDKLVETLLNNKPAGFGHLLPLSSDMSKDYLGLINRCRQDLHDTRSLPGPTGEDNLLSLSSRGLTIIATPDTDIALQQAMQANVLWQSFAGL
ncbi:Bifunctional protein PutA [Nymphon striatum]|nr:Bifunctional protein PutA [Nymphon striatum]